MPQAIPKPSSAKDAAAAIVALIHSSPRSPRQDEIEAILARVASSPVPTTSPLLEAIRDAAVRLEDAFAVYAQCVPRHPNEEALQARIDQIQSELEGLENQIPSPPQSFVDLVAWAEIARSGAGIHKDGTIAETQEDDVFERPAARLMEAVLQFPGATSMAAMSPAHAGHYREWRGLIEAHVRKFERSDDAGGGISEETKAEEARMAASMEVIDAVADKILAEPVQMWGDLLPCAEVAFWYQWAGVDSHGPHARGQMASGPMSGGEAIDQAVAKVLKGIFALAGIGQFAEVRP